MSREVPFDKDEICDVCGEKGAYDFMGDCYCVDCLEEIKEEEVRSEEQYRMKQKIIEAVIQMKGTKFKKEDVLKVIQEVPPWHQFTK